MSEPSKAIRITFNAKIEGELQLHLPPLDPGALGAVAAAVTSRLTKDGNLSVSLGAEPEEGEDEESEDKPEGESAPPQA